MINLLRLERNNQNRLFWCQFLITMVCPAVFPGVFPPRLYRDSGIPQKLGKNSQNGLFGMPLPGHIFSKGMEG
jgi:hypothetical protein